MNDIYVFDASALIALFTAYRPIFRLFMEAEAGLVQLLFPAAAIGEANTNIQADETAWTVQSRGGYLRHRPYPLAEGPGSTMSRRVAMGEPRLTANFRNPRYHQPEDARDTLDYERVADVVAATAATLVGLAGAVDE